LPFSLLLFVSS
jgi:ATP-binding cassette, subfamily C (CFTR/MRP), member 4